MYLIQFIILSSVSISIFNGVNNLVHSTNCKDRALEKMFYLTLRSTLDRSSPVKKIIRSIDIKCKTFISSNEETQYARSPRKKFKYQFKLNGKVSNN